MSFTVVDHTNDRTVPVVSRKDGEKRLQEFQGDMDLELEGPNGNTIAVNWPDNEKPFIGDGGEVQEVEAEVVDHSEGSETAAEKMEERDDTANVEVVETDELPTELQKDPIAWLEGMNADFVNRIKGKPAISKQGFRFIQSQFGITTESEVVQWVDDPVGCVVWAKAQRPNGQSAEAHGEGYQFESDVSDNEFVRYADTRAKNRAISDLTSAGALAVSELTGNNDER